MEVTEAVSEASDNEGIGIEVESVDGVSKEENIAQDEEIKEFRQMFVKLRKEFTCTGEKSDNKAEKKVKKLLNVFPNTSARLSLFLTSMEKPHLLKILASIKETLPLLFPSKNWKRTSVEKMYFTKICTLVKQVLKNNLLKDSKNLSSVMDILLEKVAFEELDITVQESVYSLCEIFVVSEYKKSDLFYTKYFEVILEASTEQINKNTLKRLAKLIEVIEFVEFEAEVSSSLKRKCFSCFLNLKILSEESCRKFLGQLFIANENLMIEVHTTIKTQLPYAKKHLLDKYATIYYYAWLNLAQDEVGASNSDFSHSMQDKSNLKEIFESKIIQEIVEFAMLLQDEILRNKFVYLLECSFHKNKTNKEVEVFLAQLYEGFFFKDLASANPAVRRNGLQILKTAFPIRDPESLSEEEDILMLKQLNCIDQLLFDNYPAVREEALRTGSFIVKKYWEILPTDFKKSFIETVAEELLYDSTSGHVRAAAVECLDILGEIPEAGQVLGRVLPRLKDFIDDSCGLVRKNMFKLLINLKERSYASWPDVIEVDQLAYQLSMDKRFQNLIVEICHDFFYPQRSEEVRSTDQLKSFLTLFSYPESVIKFAKELHFFREPEEIVKLMTLIAAFLTNSVKAMKKQWKKQQITKIKLDLISLKVGVEAINILWSSIESRVKKSDKLMKTLETYISADSFVKPLLSFVCNPKLDQIPIQIDENKENNDTGEREAYREKIKAPLLEICGRFFVDQSLEEKMKFNLCNFDFLSIENVGFEKTTKKAFESKQNLFLYCPNFDAVLLFKEMTKYLGAEIKCLTSWGSHKCLLTLIVSALDLENKESGLSLVTALWMLHSFLELKDDLRFQFLSCSKELKKISNYLFQIVEYFGESKSPEKLTKRKRKMKCDKGSGACFTILGLALEALLKLEINTTLFELKPQKTITTLKNDMLSYELPYFQKLEKFLLEKLKSCEGREADFLKYRAVVDVFLAIAVDLKRLISPSLQSNWCTSRKKLLDLLVDKIETGCATSLLVEALS